VPPNSAAAGTKKPLGDFSEREFEFGTMKQGTVLSQGENTLSSTGEAPMQDEIEALEKQPKEKNALLTEKAEAVNETKKSKEQDNPSSVSNGLLVGGQGSTSDLFVCQAPSIRNPWNLLHPSSLGLAIRRVKMEGARISHAIAGELFLSEIRACIDL
jgi:hypothetical protein